MIAAADRVTYTQAEQITGRSHSYLNQRAAAGHLRRDGGTPSEPFTTWLSRAECEELALVLYRRTMAGGYWLTRRQAAELLGLSRGYLYRLPFPHFKTALGDHVLRRVDVEAFAEKRTAKARTSRRQSGQRR